MAVVLRFGTASPPATPLTFQKGDGEKTAPEQHGEEVESQNDQVEGQTDPLAGDQDICWVPDAQRDVEVVEGDVIPSRI